MFYSNQFLIKNDCFGWVRWLKPHCKGRFQRSEVWLQILHVSVCLTKTQCSWLTTGVIKIISYVVSQQHKCVYMHMFHSSLQEKYRFSQVTGRESQNTRQVFNAALAKTQPQPPKREGPWPRESAHRRFSCSICCMELDLCRTCGAGGAVGRCHVVVLFTWSTQKIRPWLSIRASQSKEQEGTKRGKEEELGQRGGSLSSAQVFSLTHTHTVICG